MTAVEGVDLAVIVPSRGRPRQLREMVEAVHATATGTVAVYVLVDDDDPHLGAYLDTIPTGTGLRAGPRRSLTRWTNEAAADLLAQPQPPRYLASLGDDHRPRTHGWDRRLIGAIESLGEAPGIAYGNDLLQGPRLPTAWVVSAAIVRTLGWMCLPGCEHMYVDNAVLELGRASGRILYCPDVVIEHLHPLAGKGEWDASYAESNTRDRFAADRAVFDAWRTGGGLAADVAKLQRG